MKAIILIGGFGVRLRPLTLSVPKPLVEFANKPLILHQLEALKKVGCTDVILAIAFSADVISKYKAIYRPCCQVLSDFVHEWEEKLEMRIIISEESIHLGTAGPLALARDLLLSGTRDAFFLINCDVLCEFPLANLYHFHKSRKAEVTLLIKEVSDPKRFGAVVNEKNGKVTCFVEKPEDVLSRTINAGVYAIEPSLLDMIELRPTSLEKEVLPAVAARNALYAMSLNGFWTDLGQPDDYLEGQSSLHLVQITIICLGLKNYLESSRIRRSSDMSVGEEYLGNVMIGRETVIGDSCRIGPNVCIGDNCHIGRGSRLQNCAILSGTKIGNYTYCADSIIGNKCVIGNWCRLENACTFGEDVACSDELMFNGAIILPHKTLSKSVMKPEVIL